MDDVFLPMLDLLITIKYSASNSRERIPRREPQELPSTQDLTLKVQRTRHTSWYQRWCGSRIQLLHPLSSYLSLTAFPSGLPPNTPFPPRCSFRSLQQNLKTSRSFAVSPLLATHDGSSRFVITSSRCIIPVYRREPSVVNVPRRYQWCSGPSK